MTGANDELLAAYLQIAELGGNVETRPLAFEFYDRLKTVAAADPSDARMSLRQARAATFLSLNIVDDEISRLQSVELLNDVLFLAAIHPGEMKIKSALMSIQINLSTYQLSDDDESRRLGLLQHYGTLKARSVGPDANEATTFERAGAASALTILLGSRQSTRAHALRIYEELKVLAARNPVREDIVRRQADAAFGLCYYLVNGEDTIVDALRLYFEVRALDFAPERSKVLSNMGLLLVPRIARDHFISAQAIQADLVSYSANEPGVRELAFTSGVALLAWTRARFSLNAAPLVDFAEQLTKHTAAWEALVNRYLPSAREELKTSAGELRYLHLQALTGFIAAAMFGAAQQGRTAIVEALVSQGSDAEFERVARSARILFNVAKGDKAAARQLWEQGSIEGSNGLGLLALANLSQHPWFTEGSAS